jgi:integrase
MRPKVSVSRFERHHDARHTAASLLLEQGVHLRAVSEMLGHATVGMTLDVYPHVSPAMHWDAARVMDEILRPR